MSDGANDESVVIRAEPERLGRYELIQRLKGGGFREAHLARFYIAPETFLQSLPGYPTSEDARTDVYTVGVVLYELLAGRNPFVQPGPKGIHDEIIPRIAKGTCPHVRELAPELPEGLPEIIHRMMARSMHDRPNSALEACELLAPYLHSEFRAELDAAELVVRAQDHQPRLSISDTRIHGANTATQVRERPQAASVLPEERTHVPRAEARADGPISTMQESASPDAPHQESPALLNTAVVPAPRAGSQAPHTPLLPKPCTPLRRIVSGLIIGGAILAGAAFAFFDRSQPTQSLRPQNRLQIGSEAERMAAPIEKPAESPVGTPSGQPPVDESIARAPEAADDAEKSTASDSPNLETEERPETKSPSASSRVRGSHRSAGETQSTSAEKSARLVVRADVSPGEKPWEIWVDGIYMGESPAKIAVTPGEHDVAIGREHPVHHKSVRVSAQQTRNVPFHPAK